MVFDHIGLYYSDRLPTKLYILLRVLGSLALPLFSYSFILGFCKSRSLINYFLRLLIFAFSTQIILFLLLPFTGIPNTSLPLNSLFSLLCAFALLYGCEMIFAIPPDMIGSLRLIVANAQTHSDRFDVRIGNGIRACPASSGIYIPELPVGVQFLCGIALIGAAITSTFLFPIEYGILCVFLVLILYLVEKRIAKNQSNWAFFGFLLLTLVYVTVVFLATGTIRVQGAGVAAIFLCYLPLREKRPSRAVQAAFYAFYPLHIIALLLIRMIL